MTVLVLIIILAILVIGHEFGHYVAAKISGVRVEEFGLGFPPRFWGKKIKETLYSLNILPFGGFVRILGFGDTDSEDYCALSDEEKKNTLSHKGKLVQSFVMAGGIISNLIFAWLVLWLGISIGLPMPAKYLKESYGIEESRFLITDVEKNSPAHGSGVRAGDEVIFATTGGLALQGEALTPENFKKFIVDNGGKKIFVGAIAKRAEGGRVTFEVMPRKNVETGEYEIGVATESVATLKFGIVRSLYESLKLTFILSWQMIASLAGYIVGFFVGDSSIQSVSGPVGIVGVVGGAYEMGFGFVLSILAIISINFAALNLLPFPALDGGWLFIVFIEALRRKPLSSKTLKIVLGGGFLLLLTLMVVVTFNDVVRLLGY